MNLCQNLLIVCSVYSVIALAVNLGDSEGCTGSPIIPDRPFVVIWNEPSGECVQNLSNFAILENTGGKFDGDAISLLYKTGDFPSVSKGQFNNGGIPQLGNLTLHLSKLYEDIVEEIPENDFQGVAVFDFEAWRPLFVQNYDSLKQYQELSIELVKKQHPDWNNTEQITLEAIRQFDDAARLFWYSSLKMAKTFRPNGYWGYYGFPRGVGNYKPLNDQLGWLWQESTGLYPRIYSQISTPADERRKTIRTIVNETLRVKAKYSPPNTLILPYTLVQNGATYLFDETDLDLAIKLPGDVGSSGVVIWGSTSEFHTPGECAILQVYLNNVLGPYVLKLTNFYTTCSKTQCNSHGRCVSKQHELKYQEDLLRYRRTSCLRSPKEIHMLRKELKSNSSKSDLKMEDYVCNCYAGWKGSSCNIKTNNQ